MSIVESNPVWVSEKANAVGQSSEDIAGIFMHTVTEKIRKKTN